MAIFLNKGKNYIINGALDYWQRGTSFAAIINGTFFADRFAYFKSGAMVHTVTRDTDVPTLAESGFTFPYSMRANLTTPDTSIGAAEFCIIDHKVEGQILAPLLNRNINLSFWVKATATGIYTVSFRNNASDRSLVKSFTIDTTNTWEKKSVSLYLDNTGTWLTDTGIGLRIGFVLAAGSNLQAPALDTWQNGNYSSHSTAVNGVNTGATDFRVAGVQLEEGISASNFERTGNDIIKELGFCQRYFEKSYQIDIAPASVSSLGATIVDNSKADNTRGFTDVRFKFSKRVVPVVTLYNPTSGATGSGAEYSSATARAMTTQVPSMEAPFQWVTMAAAAQPVVVQWTADAEL